MKTNHYLTAFAAAAAISFAACSDDLSMDIAPESAPVAIADEGITYPHSPSFKPTVFSRSGSSFEEDWENIDSYTLGNGWPLKLPWTTDASGSYDPDIKKDSGWIMVAHNLKSVYHQTITAPFIIFYNEYSGEFKVFYYAKDVPFKGDKQTFYVFPIISFNVPNSLLNTTGQIALANNIRPSNYKWGTGTKGDNPALVDGWNSIIIPLSYDPNVANNEIYIKTDMSKILNQENQNKFLIIDIYHSKATPSIGIYNNYLVDPTFIYNNKASQSYISSIASDGSDLDFEHKAILLSSKYFSGPKVSNEDNMSISVIYERNVSCKFNVLSDSNLGFIELNLRKDSTGLEFGNWNLKENPTIYMHPVGVLSHVYYGTMSDENDYDFRATGNYKAEVVMNPQLKNKIKKYRVECTPVVYGTYEDDLLPTSFYTTTDYGSLGSKDGGRSLVLPFLENVGEIHGVKISQGAPYQTWTIRDIWSKYGRQEGPNPIYKYVYAPNNYDLIRDEKKIGLKNVFVKVAVYMEIERNGKTETLVSSRTYRPKLEWDPVYMTRYYNGQNMDYIQYAAGNDLLLQEIDTHEWENIDTAGSLFSIGEEEESPEEKEAKQDSDK